MPTARPERFGHLTQKEVESIVTRVRAVQDAPTAAWDADVIEFLFLTGLRRAELARLRAEDVDVFRGKLRVRGKTGSRVLPIVAPLKPVLVRLLDAADDDGFVIRKRSDRALSRDGHVDWALRRWREKLDNPNLHPHALRHSFATWHVDAGTPPHVLRELLGHTTLTMTMRYYHANDRDSQRAMAKMAAAFGKPEKKKPTRKRTTTKRAADDTSSPETLRRAE